jgi:hypothetical protein
MTNKWRLFPAALCVLSLACGKSPEAPGKGPATSGKPAAAVEAPSPVVEAPKGTYITKFRLGPAFGPEGTVNADVSIFRPGEPIFTSFEIPNAPAGSKVRVTWAVLPDRKPLGRQEAPLSPDKPAVAFKGDSKGWPIGDYEFEISLVEPGTENARAMGVAPFKIVKDKLR